MGNEMSLETILKIKMTCTDDDMDEDMAEELTEFIVETLNNEFRKDYLTFEAVK